MALDLDAIRNKLAQLSGRKKSASSLWKPQGKTNVRMLPLKTENGTPFHERYFYYNIGNNPGILAPHQFGKPDPIQELINKLHDDGSPESRELAKKLYPKLRTYAAVVVRGEEEKGSRLWGFGKMVYQSLLNILLDSDYGDVSDPMEGHDLSVTVTKQPGRQFATTEVMPRPKVTPLSDDADQIKQWIDDIPNIDDIYTLKSYDEIKSIVNNWLSGETHDNEHTTTAVAPRKDTNKSDKVYTDLDDAFNDLLS